MGLKSDVIQFLQLSVSEEIHSTGEILPQVSWEESTVSDTKINLRFLSHRRKQITQRSFMSALLNPINFHIEHE